MDSQQLIQAGFSEEEVSQYSKLQGAGFSDDEIIKHLSGVSKPPQPTTPPPESISVARETMANISPLTPQQELAPATLTPEEQEGAKKSALDFMWTSPKEAGRQFMKGTTTALGLAGATVGTLLAPFTPWSTALGYAAGERAGKGLEVLTGVSEPETPTQAMGATVKDVGLGLLPYGVQKTAGAISKVPEILVKPWTTGGKVKEVFKTVGGKLETIPAGESGIAGAKGQSKIILKQGDKLYEDMKSIFPEGTNWKFNNLHGTIDNILKDPYSSDAEKAFANKMLKRVSFGERAGNITDEQMLRIMEDAKRSGQIGYMERPSTVGEAYGTRSIISETTKSKDKAVARRANQMLDAWSQDITELTDKLGIPEAKKAGQKAIDFWRDKVVPQREAVKLLGKPSIEEVPNLLQKDVETVTKIKGAMPEEGFQDLKRGFVTDVSNKVEGNPVRVGKEFRKLLASKKEVMESVFNEEELEAIRISSDPGKLGKYFEEHPNAKWLAKFIGYGLAYGTIGYAGMKRIFGFSPH